MPVSPEQQVHEAPLVTQNMPPEYRRVWVGIDEDTKRLLIKSYRTEVACQEYYLLPAEELRRLIAEQK